MVERIILLVAAVLVAALFLFAAWNAPSDEADLENIQRGFEISTINSAPPADDWFREQVIESDKAVLVDFKADWCGPCRMLFPHLEDLQKKHSNKLNLVQVDVDDQPKLARHYAVGPIPMVLLFLDGRPVDGFLGYREPEVIEAIVGPHLTGSTSELIDEEQAEEKTASHAQVESVLQ